MPNPKVCSSCLPLVVRRTWCSLSLRVWVSTRVLDSQQGWGLGLGCEVCGCSISLTNLTPPSISYHPNYEICMGFSNVYCFKLICIHHIIKFHNRAYLPWLSGRYVASSKALCFFTLQRCLKNVQNKRCKRQETIYRFKLGQIYECTKGVKNLTSMGPIEDISKDFLRNYHKIAHYALFKLE